jgi:hypothetical protein
VTSPLTAETGVEGFIAGLQAQGIPVERRGGLIIYRLEPFTGAAAGREVETAVAADEATGWPTAPPHWLHAPDELCLPGGQSSEQAGWSRYSRPHPGRLDASLAPSREWTAHVRAFLGTAL